ncbi:MAG: hypothetical protein D6B25_07440 [Desulfobulbaceae bacterium]|nr:MAG: hypothetical protein D6B25_07440 [Desulfobulbaceae bacterium]
MKWLVILDPIEGLVSKTDTSLAIINKARSMGLEVDTATIEDLFFETVVSVNACGVKNEKTISMLDEYDLILMRKEPPYDLPFHYAAQLLSLTKTPVINSPASLRDFNEKLIVLPFSDFMPPTLVSSNSAEIIKFIGRFDSAVLKSLDSFQGKSVTRVSPDDMGLVDKFTEGGRQPIMVQQFLEAVYQGDKRVMMAGDRVLGAAQRRPKSGYHANFANSDALPAALTAREQEIIDTLGPWMVAHGIYFSGLDIIGEKLTEINITCPTGIIQISELDGKDIPGEVVDYFLELIADGTLAQ